MGSMGSPTPPKPFVVLDDARASDGANSGANSGSGAADARVYREPVEVFAAYRPKDVERVLAKAEAARESGRGELAGYIAYEAGLALEPRLEALAEARNGAAGPLVWLGLFEGEPERIAARDMPAWLAANSEGTATLGPLDPPLSADPRCRIEQADFFAAAASKSGFDPETPTRRFDAILIDIVSTHWMMA